MKSENIYSIEVNPDSPRCTHLNLYGNTSGLFIIIYQKSFFKLYLCVHLSSNSSCLWVKWMKMQWLYMNTQALALCSAWHIIMCKMTFGGLRFGSGAVWCTGSKPEVI